MALAPSPPAGPALRVALATAKWLYARTFRFPLMGWFASAVIGVAGAVGTVLVLGTGAVALAGAGVGALFAVICLAAVATWLRTARRSDRLLVFLTPFDEASADTTRVAPLHVRALQQHIRTDPLLERAVEVRVLRGPLRPNDAARLLMRAKGHVLVGGDVTTVRNVARWAPWMMVRWSFAEGYFGIGRIHFGRYRLGPPALTRLLHDPSAPIEVFAEADLDLPHIEAVHAALLLLASQEIRDAHSAARLRAASNLREALPLRLRALLLIAENAPARLWPPRELVPKARALAAAGEHEADDPYLWAEVNTFLLLAERVGESRPSERIPYARRVAQAMPEAAAPQFGLGACLLALGEERAHDGDVDAIRQTAEQAIEPLRRALRLPRGPVPRREIRRVLRRAERRASE